ncbi:hypothetical protein Pfo_001799 [Paulownia fortunei]|nr:hypothetical protein Pfo_001799 [Paulownia fortunei]
MEDSSLPTTFEAKIKGIRFALATRQEICKASISDCPISHASQLSNPFLGLPLETGKCESCGTGEAGQCEGHFGYIELPTPIYHPDHVGELKRMLSLLCLKCLKFKNRKFQVKNVGVMERVLSSCCEETSQISINEAKTTDGAYYLELKVPSRSRPEEGFWNFLEKYGFRYGHTYSRPLLPSEVMAILRKLPQETRKKLSAKGYFPQDGYILHHLPVPPNCLSVPDISDGISTMSTDYSLTLLKKVLKQVEIIKNSRSGMPNFESHEIEANDLQAAVAQYLQFRGTSKASRDVDTRFGVNKEINASSTKAWLEKMKTLFIRKGSGFSSRSVITGDPFKGVSEIGLPFEIAQKITFEERVNQHNMEFLQKLVDEKLCLTYRDGMSTYSLREGSKGHTFLRPGQVVHRRIMDGDIVFINRPPTTHKHSLQALSVYVHDDHTVKINPLICGPLSADFDGDCIHLFYPQSLEAKAEVVELFSVEKQLLSSHTGNFNLQLATDSLLSLKILFRKYFLSRAAAQQLAMFVPNVLSRPAVIKSDIGPLWTASQILQTTLPPSFACSGERHVISNSEVLSLDFNRDVMASIANDIVTSLFFLKGPKEVLRFFNSIQPLLMESLYSEGFSVSLRDLFLPRDVLESIQENIQKISPLLYHLRSSYSESIALQLDSYLRSVKIPVTNFILKSSRIGHLIDSKSESALSKVVQQIGFLGMQLSDKGKFYSETLVKDMSSLFQKKYPSCDDYPAEEFGLVGRTLFRGLDPYQEMVHSISSREVIVRSTRGLTEPGTLFKNLMAILRDVVICYDGTVRNMCSNSIIQFEYGVNSANIASEFCAGDPVGVLAATAMSNPAYKAVLDSSPSSNSSWEMMKEILLCGVSFKNDISDRRVILYLNNCDCGRKHCQESAALIVKNQLKKVSLKDTAIEFLIEYRSQMVHESYDINPGLVGHIHLNKTQLIQSNISMHDILEKCQDTINLHQKKKKVGNLFRRIELSFSDCCSFCQSSKSKWTDVPCIQFLWQGARDDLLERASHLLADTVCPVLLQTIIKGDPRVSTANVVWISPDTATWIRSPCKSPKGELALDIILEKEAVKRSGDAWRVVMDSCLPVIHLIDTQRSIPYAIKQVQELLGISCAFEQAVQRLSTSVTMVTKGVLKDHLLLLGNSMTCAGTLIGFNAGGIKSLSRSLDVQVPFMNATLFTPRKCFERAAEKCYVDNLSSIVASCAWGKHVSVGTGSPFEILWDTRKAELRLHKEIDAYNFLHMVNSSSKPEDMGTSCLGAEIEDLDHEDEFMEFDLSPVRESGLDKPTFEDGIEFGLNGDDNEDAKECQNSWSSWGKKVDSEENDWTKKAEESTWGKKVDYEENDWRKKADQSTWGKEVDSEENDLTKKPEQSTWGKKVDSEENDWTKKPEQSTWGKDVNSEENDWMKKPEQSTWGKQVNSEENDWTKKPEQSTWGKKVTSEENDRTKMGEQSTYDEETQNSSAWGKKDEQSTWGKKVDSEKNDWTKKLGQSTWGKKVTSEENDRTKMGEQSTYAEETQNSSAWGKKVDSDGGGWAKKTEQSTWGKKVNSKENDWTKMGEQSTYAEEAQKSSAWGKKADSEGGGWVKKDEQNKWARSSSTEPRGQSNWAVASGGKDWGEKDDQSTMVDAGEPSVGGQERWERDSDEKGWKKNDKQNSWGNSSVTNPCGQSSHNRDSNQKGWSKMNEQNSWGNASTPKTDNQSTWGRDTTKIEDVSSARSQEDGLWSSASGAQKETPQNDSSKAAGWYTLGSGADSLDVLGSKENHWEAKVADQATNSKPSNTWGSSNDWGKFDSQSPTGEKKESPFNNWSSSQKHSNDSTVAQGWGSPKVDTSGEKDVRSQWGRGRGRGRGWGRGGRSRESSQGRGPFNDGEWKNKRTRPIDDPNALGLFTVTRQRLDSFTVEEQDVLSETESIMKNIRRVMNQTGYSDGDPLSTDDQTYIIDNVFNYHPDKAVKMRAGIDYIMVSRHGEFQDSRCFYAVSVDGGKADFSYRKCLENFIRGKYPDKAEAFIPKYFKKPQPRSGWNRDRGPARTEAGTPSWNRDSTPAPDEAGTPGWNRDQTPGPDDAGTPGWNKDQGPATDEAETQTSA